MALPPAQLLQQIVHVLETDLHASGFYRGVLIHLDGQLVPRIAALDVDWTDPDSQRTAQRELYAWAVPQLITMAIPRRAPYRAALNLWPDNYESHLTHVIAHDPEVVAQARAARQALWGTDDVPFARLADLQECKALEWFEATAQQAAPGAFYALNLVLRDPRGVLSSAEAQDALQRLTQATADAPQPPATLADLVQVLGSLDGAHVDVRGLQVLPCDADGSPRHVLKVNSANHQLWSKSWAVPDAGPLRELWERARAIEQITRKWTVTEAATFILFGRMPTMVPEFAWRGGSYYGADLIITLRGRFTSQFITESLDRHLTLGHAYLPEPAETTPQERAVLQAVQATPGTRWRDRLAFYEALRVHHPEVPAYEGRFPHLLMRRTYLDLLERHKRTPIEMRPSFDETTLGPGEWPVP